jgi:hypothetical protein
MAELKKLGREIAQPNAPDLSGASKAFETLGNVGKSVTKTVVDYNKAIDEMQSASLYADVSFALKSDLINQSSPENIAQGNAAQRYLQYSAQTIEGALANAPRGHVQTLGEKLKSVAQHNALALMRQERDYTFKKSKETTDIALEAATDNYKDASATGNAEAKQAAHEEISKLYDNGIALGMYGEKNKVDGLKALRQTDIVERWKKRGENDALAGPGVVEKAEADIAENFPEEGVTNEERLLALQAYSQGKGVVLTREQALKAINAGRVNLDILKGIITIPDQIYQHDLTALQGTQAEINLWKHQNKSIKTNDKLAKFLENVQQGAGRQNIKASPEIKEKGYQVMSALYLNAKKEQTGNPDEQLTIEDQADILSQMNVSIPSVDAQVNYALEHGNLDTEFPLVDWALGIARTVGKQTPNALGLSSKSMAIANLANQNLQYGRTDARGAIEGARNAVNVDEPILAGRRARQYKDGWEKEMRNAFVEITEGADPDTNPTAWGAFRSIYSTQAMLTDNKAAAREGARQVMTPAFGNSKYFPEGNYGYLPHEKVVPFADAGNWLESQINLKLIDIAEANHNAPSNQISNLSKIELGGEAIQAQALRSLLKSKNLSEEDIYYYGVGPRLVTQYATAPERLKYRIAGHEREVFLEAQSESRLSDEGKFTYAVYTINPNSGLKEPVMDPRSRTGFATITIDSFEEFLPSVYKKLNNELFESATKDIILKKYKEENRIPLLRTFGLSKAIKEQGPAIHKQLEEREKKYTQNDKQTLTTASGYTVDIREEYGRFK